MGNYSSTHIIRSLRSARAIVLFPMDTVFSRNPNGWKGLSPSARWESARNIDDDVHAGSPDSTLSYLITAEERLWARIRPESKCVCEMSSPGLPKVLAQSIFHQSAKPLGEICGLAYRCRAQGRNDPY